VDSSIIQTSRNDIQNQLLLIKVLSEPDLARQKSRLGRDLDLTRLLRASRSSFSRALRLGSINNSFLDLQLCKHNYYNSQHICSRQPNPSESIEAGLPRASLLRLEPRAAPFVSHILYAFHLSYEAYFGTVAASARALLRRFFSEHLQRHMYLL